MSEIMPAIFVGHGNPMNALYENQYMQAWAAIGRFVAREMIAAGEHQPLVNYRSLGPDAMLSAPTPAHYLPLLYVLALQRDGDAVTFPASGFDGGSISMLTVQIE